MDRPASHASTGSGAGAGSGVRRRRGAPRPRGEGILVGRDGRPEGGRRVDRRGRASASVQGRCLRCRLLASGVRAPVPALGRGGGGLSRAEAGRNVLRRSGGPGALPSFLFQLHPLGPGVDPAQVGPGSTPHRAGRERIPGHPAPPRRRRRPPAFARHRQDDDTSAALDAAAFRHRVHPFALRARVVPETADRCLFPEVSIALRRPSSLPGGEREWA